MTDPRRLGLKMCLDLSARGMGFALGRGGRVEDSGVVALKDSDDTLDKAAARLGFWLEKRFDEELPEVVIYESPMDPRAALQMRTKQGAKRSDPLTVALLYYITGALIGVCAYRNVRRRPIAVTSHRKATTGRGTWPDGDAKEQTIKAVNLRKLVPYRVMDDNEADALSIFVWACAEYERMHAGDFVLRGAA